MVYNIYSTALILTLTFCHFLALTCHSKRLLMHLWWFVWFNILNNTVPCLRDLLIFVNPRHSFSPYTCSIHVAGEIEPCMFIFASLHVFVLDDRRVLELMFILSIIAYIRKRKVRNFMLKAIFGEFQKFRNSLCCLFLCSQTHSVKIDWIILFIYIYDNVHTFIFHINMFLIILKDSNVKPVILLCFLMVEK